MTRDELKKVTTEQERDQVFTRLLLMHGKSPLSTWQNNDAALARWETAVLESIRQIKPKLDAEMVLWHYECWLTTERRKARG